MIENTEVVIIRDVIFPSDSEELRALILEYADWLSIDLSYQNFAGELASLETLFSLPNGQYTFAIVQSRVAGGVGFRRVDERTAEVKRLNRHQFARHLSAIQNGYQRGAHEQQTLS